MGGKKISTSLFASCGTNLRMDGTLPKRGAWEQMEEEIIADKIIRRRRCEYDGKICLKLQHPKKLPFQKYRE